MKIKYSKKSIVALFPESRKVLSSAPYAGGFRSTDLILNLRTSARETKKHHPEFIISDFLRKKGLIGSAVGFLTSAHLDYAQFIRLQHGDIGLLSIVTAGTSNALNITDRSATLFTGEALPKPGTINIILITNAELFEDCYVSALISATEAKTAALFDLRVKSVVSGRQATGTGTDAMAIVSGKGIRIQYAGGHTRFGQLIGEAVYTGVRNALTKQKMEAGTLATICEGLD
jgi:adenosylcobinamide amidohydrolase